MIILGLNAGHLDASAALLVDGNDVDATLGKAFFLNSLDLFFVFGPHIQKQPYVLLSAL